MLDALAQLGALDTALGSVGWNVTAVVAHPGLDTSRRREIVNRLVEALAVLGE
jgi:hypothetical protein